MLLSLCKRAFPFVPNVCIQDRPSFIRRMDNGTLNDTCIRMTSFLVVNFSFGEVVVKSMCNYSSHKNQEKLSYFPSVLEIVSSSI